MAIIPAIEIARPLRLSAPANALLSDKLSAKDYLGQLVEHEHYTDAIRFVARLIPSRYAVWWLTLCAWHASNREPSDDELNALRAALNWVMQPSEAHWQAAKQIAHGKSLKSPAICAAQAAFLAGSQSDPDQPFREYKRDMSAKLAASGVTLAVARARKNGLPFDYRCALLLGIQVADGELTWSLDEAAGQ